MAVSQKTKNRTPIWHSNPTPGYLSKNTENTNLIIIYNSPDTAASSAGTVAGPLLCLPCAASLQLLVASVSSLACLELSGGKAI